MVDNGLSGKLAVVTGGAQGIGEAIGRELQAQGCRVVIADMNESIGAAKADQFGFWFIRLDVTKSESVSAVVAAIEDEHGPIDIWINNAGIAVNAPAEEMTDEQFKTLMAVNLDGVFYCCREVGRRMLARGKGSIVNIASMSGSISNHPQPQCAYNASKAAVIMLSKSLAGEWAARGVRVNSISPGYTRTAILDQVEKLQPDWTNVWFSETPIKRAGEVQEIANVVAFVASDKASFMTGSDVTVDGGYTVW